jgi:hypothetical protein
MAIKPINDSSNELMEREYKGKQNNQHYNA